MIVKDVKNFIKNSVTSYAQIIVDVLQSGNAIAIRQLPSDNNINRYMDGTRSGEFDFAMYAKHIDPEVAIEQLEVYEELLDLPDDFCLTDECSVGIEPNSDIAFVNTNEDLTTTYVNTFKLKYTKESK